MDFKKINFRQPKYLLPAILYLPLLFVGYIVCDIFDTKIADASDPRLKTTDYLSDALPEANTDSILGDKMTNTEKEFGNISDLSGVESIENDRDSVNKKEDYDSKYSDSEASSVLDQNERMKAEQERRTEEQRKLRDMQNKVRERKGSGSDFVSPVTDSDIEKVQRMRRQRDWEEMNRDLASSPAFSDQGSRRGNSGTKQNAEGNSYDEDSFGDSEMGGNSNYGSSSSTGTSGNSSSYGNGDREDGTSLAATGDKPHRVYKKEVETSKYFNTLSAKKGKNKMITAIIDENIKAVDGSRVRLRLLDDIVIDDVTVKKGTYIYATMSGFGNQRVQGQIQSIFYDEEIISVELKMYDTDGLEGLYVPESSFRETSKDVISQATSGGNNLVDNSSSTTGIKGWANNAFQQTSQKVMQALGAAVKKNRVKLKYGTKVYLVDESQKEKKRKN